MNEAYLPGIIEETGSPFIERAYALGDRFVLKSDHGCPSVMPCVLTMVGVKIASKDEAQIPCVFHVKAKKGIIS